MSERDCNKCLWARRDGGCASWDCEFVEKGEAYKAWLMREPKCESCEVVTKGRVE